MLMLVKRVGAADGAWCVDGGHLPRRRSKPAVFAEGKQVIS